MGKPNDQYENFDRTMQQLLRVPHSEIKKKLDEEKEAKKRSLKRKNDATKQSSH